MGLRALFNRCEYTYKFKLTLCLNEALFLIKYYGIGRKAKIGENVATAARN